MQNNGIKRIRVLMLGDIVGASGRAMFQKHAPRLKRELEADAIVVNGENSSAHGRGITSKIVKSLRHCGADVVTSGNHIWQNKEIYHYIDQNTDLLRPENFPGGVPGKGVTTFECKGFAVAVVNLQGRVFMKEHIDCPFRCAESILAYLKHKTPIVLVDFHAETTAEKMALGHFLDGKVTAVVGTHTHVQTADQRVLPGGTAFVSDLGMAGALNGMLGQKKEPIIEHFIKQMPTKFVVDLEPPYVLSGVSIDIDVSTGKAIDIKPIRVIDEDLHVEKEDEEEKKRY
jgi:hypothetical protein